MQFPNMFFVDVDKGPVTQPLHPLFLGDALANRIGVYLYKDGEPFSPGGSAFGRAVLSGGETVLIQNGVVSENQIYIDLPSGVYAEQGPVKITVSWTDGTTTTTVLEGTGNVRLTETGTIIDPGTIISDVTALIQAIETAVASIPPTYTDLLETIAPVFSTDDDYTAGQYAWYEGSLYRFTANHSAGTWSGADVVLVTVGAETAGAVRYDIAQSLTAAQKTQAQANIGATPDTTLSVAGSPADAAAVGQVRSAFDSVVDLNGLASEIIVGTWIDSTAIRYDNGQTRSSTNFNATDYLPVTPGETISLPIPVYKSSTGTQAVYGLMFYTSAKAYISNSGHQMKLATGDNTAEIVRLTVPDTAAYVRTTWYKDTATYDWDGTFEIIRYPAVTEGGYLVELGQDEINEYCGITSSGISYTMTLWGVTSYIDCHGVGKITVKMPVISSSVSNVVGLDFYDQSKTKLSFVAANRGDANGAEMRTLTVPEGAYYFRTTYWKTDNAKLYGGDFYCSFRTTEYDIFRPYQSGYIFYSPLVNQSVNQYWETDLDTELGADMKQTTGVLLLPENYNPNGKPVPVIMYFHGISHYVYYDHWGDDEAFRTQKAQWAAQGFAVIDCNGARNNNKTGHFTSGGSLQYTDGYHRCFEYVKRHYNVEQFCHVICASAGGIPGINYCYWFNDAKSLQMLSAWTSLRNNQYATGQTASMIEYLGCDFTDGYDATADKTIGFDPTLRILTIDSTKYLPQLSIPAKAFLGSTEEGNHIWTALQNFVAALRNAGQSVSLRIVDGATHKNICSDDILALNTEYANFCKSV